VITVEITRAVRSVALDGIEVKEKDFIGVVNDKLVAAGPEMDAIIHRALDHARAETHEIVTIYYGAECDQASASSLAERIHSWYPDLETEVVSGGQPFYPYIMSVE
jgi:dihydroxyacetone kinase-like predicted kinase